MIRLLAAIAVLATLPLGEKPPKERDLAKDLLGRVAPRVGVVNGSLAVVPLVLIDGAKTVAVPPVRAVAWSPVGKAPKADSVTVTRKSEEGVALVAGGSLLQGGVRERMLSRPLLVGDEPAVTAARFSDRREKPVKEAAERAVGRIAPLLQRKLDLVLEDEDALTEVLQIQSFYAGTEVGKHRVEDLFSSPGIAPRVEALKKTLGVVPRSYGGGTCGYVAFFGHRAVEVVLFSSPEAFGKLGPGYLRALAVSSAIWDKAVGWPAMGDSPKPSAYLAPAVAVMTSLRQGRIRRVRSGAREKKGGQLYRLLPKHVGDGAEGQGEYAGRILVAPDGRPLSLEAFEYGGNLAFPTALRKPGGRPVDARPNVKSGAMTMGYLQRLAGRRAAARAGLR